MADTRLSDLSAAGALSASDLFYVVQTPGSGGEKATGTQLLTLVGTTYVPLAGGTMTGALTLPAGAVGAPSLMFTGAGATTGIYSSGANNISVAINGAVAGYWGAGSLSFDTALVMLNDSGYVRFGAASGYDPVITRAGNGSLYLRTVATSMACAFHVSGLYTDANNYERLTLTGVAGTSVNITAETLGTGGDNINIVLTPAGTGRLTTPAIFETSAIVAGILAGGATTINYYTGGVRTASTGEFAWTVGNANASVDTALMRNAAGVVEVNNGTAATYRDLKLRNLLAGGGDGSYVQTPSMKVANLAAAEAAGAGARAFVTDADATTFLSTVHGGGSYKVPVVSDGTNWLIG